MRIGVVASMLLHLCAFGLAFLSLPESWRSKIVPEPYVPIEILSEAELAARTSVPAARPKPKPVEPETKPAPAKIETPPPALQKPEPEPVKPAPKPELQPAPVKEKPKPKPKKPESDDLDLDALSALIDKAKKAAPAADAPAETPIDAERPQNEVGAGDRLTASDVSKMRAAIARCWQTSALIGAPEPEKLIVQVAIRLNRDGTLADQPRTLNAAQIGFSGNQFWKAAEQIALRAVISCQPYDFLDQNRYDVWKEMQLNFDPSEMVGF